MLRKKWLCLSVAAIVLLLQGCAAVPFHRFRVEGGGRARVFSEGETILIVLEEKAYRPSIWNSRPLGVAPEFTYTVHLRNVLTNKEDWVWTGEISEGWGFTYNILIRRSSMEATGRRTDPEGHLVYRYWDVPPGSYLVTVRWSPPDVPWAAKETWPEENVMTIPLTVK
jgi:hypothetical protein